MNNKQKKGFNQMMSILMLGLISAGGGVGVASFAQDQQGSLSATTGGAGLREAITIENVELIVNGAEDNAVLVVRNVGSVDAIIGSVYFDGSLINASDLTITDDFLIPGESTEILLSTGDSITGGSQHQLKVTTQGGGVTTTSTTAPQR